MKSIWRKSEILDITLYALALILILTPYYSVRYRILVNLLHFVLFWLSLFIIAITFIRLCISHASVGRIFLALGLGLLVWFTGRQAHDWRYAITDGIIKGRYCDRENVEPRILGGITEIRIDGVERTGAFENASHCVLVPCVEEFYYCDDATVVIGP